MTDPTPLARAERIRAIEFFSTDELLLIREKGGCRAELVDLRTTTVAALADLAFCPDRISRRREDQFLLSEGAQSATLTRSPFAVSPADDALALSSDRSGIVRLTGDSVTWTRDGRTSIFPGKYRDPRFVPEEETLLAVESTSEGERIMKFTFDRKEPALVFFEPQARIDSYDVDPKGKEIVLSADRGSGFDVALASLGEQKVNWVWPEPPDEVNVSWAPRGNKVSYVVQNAGTSTLRTVHVPTGVLLSVDLGSSHVRQVAWQPGAERFAVVFSTPTESDRVDVMRYGGEERRPLVRSTSVSTAVADVLPASSNGAVLFAPATVRYGERYAVVMISSEEPVAWNDLAQALVSENVGVVVARPEEIATNVLGDAVRGLPWADHSSMMFVMDHAPERELGRERVLLRGPADSADEIVTSGNVTTIRGDELFESRARAYILQQARRAPQK